MIHKSSLADKRNYDTLLGWARTKGRKVQTHVNFLDKSYEMSDLYGNVNIKSSLML